MKIRLLSALVLFCSLSMQAQDVFLEPADTVPVLRRPMISDSTAVRLTVDSLITDWPDEYLDTVKLSYTDKLNNYSMIGVEYGITLTGMQFSPSQNQTRDIVPNHFSVLFTKYEKMFNYLPYFGWTIGVSYGYEGYTFKENKETGITFEYPREKSRAIRMRVLEVPFMMQYHVDTRHFKTYAGIGIYGGYRTSIVRSGPHVEEAYKTGWYDTDIRWDYGFQGGAGIALIFEPLEFHIKAQLRYGMSSIFTPDSMFPDGSGFEDQNKVYYRYAYPLDVIISAGVHIHLGKRYGTTKSDLKRKAKEIVYGENR